MSDEGETVVACARITTPLYMEDNVVSTCSECGWKVQHRPHAPAVRKICLECAVDLAGPDTKVEVPPRMLDDLKAYYAKKRH